MIDFVYIHYNKAVENRAHKVYWKYGS